MTKKKKSTSEKRKCDAPRCLGTGEDMLAPDGICPRCQGKGRV